MKKIPEAELRVVERGYGSLTVLASPRETGGAVSRTDIKKLYIEPGKETSSHYHLLAESVFVVLEGRVIAKSGDSCLELEKGDVLLVAPGERHQILNVGSSDALLVETQSPPYAVWDTFPGEKEFEWHLPERRCGRFWKDEEAGRIRIKVCGIRSLDAALACFEAGVDAVGLNFTRRSKGLRELDRWLAWIPNIPRELSVFVLTDSEAAEEVKLLATACNADTVQIQGEMDLNSLLSLIAACKKLGLRVVKSVSLGGGGRVVRDYIAGFGQEVHAILFDSSWRGGTGIKSSKDLLAEVRAVWGGLGVVAGGLTSENVTEVLQVSGADAVDVESGVEERLGGVSVKSSLKIREFVAAVGRCSSTKGGEGNEREF